mmetsp:Transcript_32165/g.75166  ORF Transcript_32165/g.75166 Transcript_32165/m.75166 type:complete len:272 (+) Transcript_32165:40-855(+)
MEPGGSCSRWSPAVPASEGDGQGDCTPSHRQTADSSSGGQSEQDAIVHFDWEPGQVLNRRYRLHSKAGEGAFGRVCLTKNARSRSRSFAMSISLERPLKRRQRSWRLFVQLIRGGNFVAAGCTLPSFRTPGSSTWSLNLWAAAFTSSPKRTITEGFGFILPGRSRFQGRSSARCRATKCCARRKGVARWASRSSTLATRFGNMIAVIKSSTRGSIGGPRSFWSSAGMRSLIFGQLAASSWSCTLVRCCLVRMRTWNTWLLWSRSLLRCLRP